MRVIWSVEAERFLLETPAHAETILDAVDRLASEGIGFVRNMQDGQGTLGLYIDAHLVLFLLSDDGTIRIVRVRGRGSSAKK